MIIKPINKEHATHVIEMMNTFYSSPAVHTNGSKEIFETDVLACATDNPYLEGYIFIENDDICGYAMLAKSFSTEFGKPCIWIEDIYFKEQYRNKGFCKIFFEFVDKKYPTFIKRLELDEENERALHVYTKCGYERLPYVEMIKLK